MQTLRKHLAIAAGIGTLAVIGTIMNSHQVKAAGAGPTVTIDPTQLPLQVTGSTSVSGTVGLAAGSAVSVNNATSSPVPVRDMNDGIQPVQATGSCSSPAFTIGCGPLTIYTVPPGKRLVIEYASMNACLLPGQTIELQIETELCSQFVTHNLPSVSTVTPGAGVIACNAPSASTQVSSGEVVHLYADPGTPVLATGLRDSNTGLTSFSFSISGHLVDFP